MSQHDFTIDNQTFPATRSDINSALQALASLSSGASSPSTTFAYQLWVDTTSDPNILNVRNSANNAWIEIGEINQGSAAFILTAYAILQAGSAAAPSHSFDTDRDTGMYRAAANIIGFATNGTERVRINDSGQAEFSSGTAALPSITAIGDLNTGMHFPAADTVAISTGGTERVRVTSTGFGLNGSTSGTLTIAASAVAGTNTITFPAATDTVVGIAATQTLTNKTLTGTVFSAGTTSVSPVNLTSGTNLTTAIAGAIEYDGKVFYGTPQSTQRGVIPGMQYYRLNADRIGLSQATTQTVFNVGAALSASTVYEFEGLYLFTRLSGGTTTSQTMGAGFTYSGTVGNFGACYRGQLSSANGSNSNDLALSVTSITPVACTTSFGSAIGYSTVFLKGTISTSTAGTLNPQYITSAAAGAFTLLLGSYFRIFPIGTAGSSIQVGAWT